MRDVVKTLVRAALPFGASCAAIIGIALKYPKAGEHIALPVGLLVMVGMFALVERLMPTERAQGG